MELEAQAALAENERAAQADAAAKKETALLIERERLRFVRRQITASERATEVALQILNQPFGDSKPDSAAKLFSVAHNIGSSALGLPGASHSLEVSGIGAPPVNIAVVLEYDAQSFRTDEIQKQFLIAHPEHAQPERGLREITERQSEWVRRNGANGDGE